MLTDRQRTLVRHTWAQVLPIAPTAAALFYDRLFETAPALRPLFAHADLDAQGTKLVQVLGFAVAHLDRLDALAPALEGLGRRHAGYGVRDGDYAAVGDALLWTLARGLGDALTPEARAAWATTYDLLAGIMRSAVAGAPAPRPRAARLPAATLALAALLALGAAPARAAAQTIDTRNATPTVGSTTSRFGQTFTVPVGANSLDRFAFFLTLSGDGGSALPPAFRTFVFAWDGTAVVGPALYASAPRETSCCSPVEESFLTGGVPVVGGASYVALVERLVAGVADARPGDASGEPVDSYAGGGATTAACPAVTPIAECAWFTEAADRAFVAQFSTRTDVVPEPGALSLVVVGGAAWLGVRARRRRVSGAR